MALICEDLAKHGVVLIPPSRPEYFESLADIERRLQSRPKGSPPLGENDLSIISEHDDKSAILLNRASVPIVSLALIWWFPGINGHVVPHRIVPGTNPSELLPFTIHDRYNKFQSYWNTIFPGSKRLMRPDGSKFGDNSDVRPAEADELSVGGFVQWGEACSTTDLHPLKLTLDGVFFRDGAFAGKNRLGTWESTVFTAEASLACAALAQETLRNSQPPADFFRRVQEFTGATDVRRSSPRRPFGDTPGPLDPEPMRKRQRELVGRRVLSFRKFRSDEQALNAIAAWSYAPVPKFHKLAS